jgi:hypothetical protein
VSLGWKAGIVLALMIVVGVLSLVARRRNYEGVRKKHTTRKERVPVDQDGDEGGESG